MGLIDLKSKAVAFDKAQEHARNADLHNAQVAAFTKGRTDGELAGMQKMYEGLAAAQAPRYNINPQGFANVPGQEMGAGYKMPVQGQVGPSSYSKPIPAPVQEQGLWKTLLEKAGMR